MSSAAGNRKALVSPFLLSSRIKSGVTVKRDKAIGSDGFCPDAWRDWLWPVSHAESGRLDGNRSRERKPDLATPPSRPRGATIIDVAKRAGVSPMTVSRVINAGKGVRDETRKTVEEAIRELHYTPNIAARSLVTSGETRIAVIYANPSAAFMSDFLAGVFEEASSKGTQLSLLKGENGRAPKAEAIERIIAAGVTGVILAPPIGEAAAVRRMLRAASIPMAVVGAAASEGTISVRIDDHRAAYDMTRHLLGLGHRRLGFVIGNPNQSASAERLGGFHSAIREVEGVETVVVQGDFSYASGLAAGEALLGAASPPTAIFASNDDMAAAIVSVAHRRGIDVPRDLSVVGFDDTTAAVTLWPPLTTIRQPLRAMAATAFNALARDMRAADEGAAREHVLDHLLVERQSTGAPAGR
jgi:LacI family transcriptional regulator